MGVVLDREEVVFDGIIECWLHTSENYGNEKQ